MGKREADKRSEGRQAGRGTDDQSTGDEKNAAPPPGYNEELKSRDTTPKELEARGEKGGLASPPDDDEDEMAADDDAEAPPAYSDLFPSGSGAGEGGGGGVGATARRSQVVGRLRDRLRRPVVAGSSSGGGGGGLLALLRTTAASGRLGSGRAVVGDGVRRSGLPKGGPPTDPSGWWTLGKGPKPVDKSLLEGLQSLLNTRDESPTLVDIHDEYCNGTLEEYLRDARYIDWRNGTGQLLCISGKSGVGKSMLAAHTVDDLSGHADVFHHTLQPLNDDCDNKDDVWLAILSQMLSVYSPARLAPNMPRTWSSVSLVEYIVRVLIECRGSVGPVALVIDGVDDSLVVDQLREPLRILLKSGVKVLLSGRNLSFTDTDSKCPDAAGLGVVPLHLCLSRTRQSDLTTYLRGKLQQNIGFWRGEVALGDIVHGPDSSFLVAKLAVMAAATAPELCLPENGVFSLPAQPSDAYRQMLDRIMAAPPSRNAEMAKLALVWTALARRPLTYLELSEAVACSVDATDNGDVAEKDAAVPAASIRAATRSGLLAVVPSGRRPEPLVEFVHGSARDFVLARMDGFLPGARLRVARTCLAYLARGGLQHGFCTDAPALRRRLEALPLLRYAARHWGAHAREVQGALMPELTTFLLDSPGARVAAWQVLHHRDPSPPGGACAPPPLEKGKAPRQTLPTAGETWWHVAAFWGLGLAIRRLSLAQLRPPTTWDAPPRQVEEVGARDVRGRTALHYAAMGGHVETVASLWRVCGGAELDVDAVDADGWTPLVHAVMGRHRAAAARLVEAGADVEVLRRRDFVGAPRDGWTRLFPDVDALLRPPGYVGLELEGEVTKARELQQAPTWPTDVTERDGVVSLKEVSVALEKGGGEEGGRGYMEMDGLVRQAADALAQRGHAWEAAHMVRDLPRRAVWTRFLGCGPGTQHGGLWRFWTAELARVGAKRVVGRQLCEAAVLAGDARTLRGLLEWDPTLREVVQGVGVDIACPASPSPDGPPLSGVFIDHYATTLLHLAVCLPPSASSAAVLATLLASGAASSANQPTHPVRFTPLHLACSTGSPAAASALVAHVPWLRIGARDATGRTPLHWACAAAKLHRQGTFDEPDPEARAAAAELVRILLERGADVLATDGDGNTPLHYAANARCEEAMRVLVDAGAAAGAACGGLAARNNVGKTPLLATVSALPQPRPVKPLRPNVTVEPHLFRRSAEAAPDEAAVLACLQLAWSRLDDDDEETRRRATASDHAAIVVQALLNKLWDAAVWLVQVAQRPVVESSAIANAKSRSDQRRLASFALTLAAADGRADVVDLLLRAVPDLSLEPKLLTALVDEASSRAANPALRSRRRMPLPAKSKTDALDEDDAYVAVLDRLHATGRFSAGTAPDVGRGAGMAPLHHAIIRGHISPRLLAWLLDHGANVAARDSEGFDAPLLALVHGNWPALGAIMTWFVSNDAPGAGTDAGPPPAAATTHWLAKWIATQPDGPRLAHLTAAVQQTPPLSTPWSRTPPSLHDADVIASAARFAVRAHAQLLSRRHVHSRSPHLRRRVAADEAGSPPPTMCQLLWWAVLRGNVPLVRALVPPDVPEDKRPADPTCPECWDRPPLYEALLAKDAECLGALLLGGLRLYRVLRLERVRVEGGGELENGKAVDEKVGVSKGQTGLNGGSDPSLQQQQQQDGAASARAKLREQVRLRALDGGWTGPRQYEMQDVAVKPLLDWGEGGMDMPKRADVVAAAREARKEARAVKETSPGVVGGGRGEKDGEAVVGKEVREGNAVDGTASKSTLRQYLALGPSVTHPPKGVVFGQDDKTLGVLEVLFDCGGPLGREAVMELVDSGFGTKDLNNSPRWKSLWEKFDNARVEKEGTL